MGKFPFSMPGRSKKAPKNAIPTEPLSKAHKILGSTQLSIEGSGKSWDNGSKSGFSAAATEYTAPTSGVPSTSAAPAREWGDESDIVPSHMKRLESYEGANDSASDISGALREMPSTSTIKSWYDKTKLPLHISQQTSASAIAKGPPSKAQRLLDMDNTHNHMAKSKKKPSRLNLSRLKPETRSDRTHHAQPLLNNDYITRSPSMYGPTTPSPLDKRLPRKIQKRPTKENLNVQAEMTAAPRPVTSGSQRPPIQNHMNELPSLYKHYEQMSFAQIMGYEGLPESEVSVSVTRSGMLKPVAYHPSTVDENVPKNLHGHPAAPPPLTIVTEPQSPLLDCAASISSRHTRTSKASRRTERSFNVTDLQETSMLMLSSDSEEEEDQYAFNEPATKLTASNNTSRRPSDVDISPLALFERTLPQSRATEKGFDSQTTSESVFSQSSWSSSGRVSQAPPGFLTVPSEQTNRPRSTHQSDREEVLQTQKWQNGSSASASSRSTKSASSSINTAVRWSQAGFEVQEARAVTLHQAKGPTEQVLSDNFVMPDTFSDIDTEEAPQFSPGLLVNANNQQPTPPMSPMSPYSMDFYIRSSRPPSDAINDPEQIPGLTHQEQILIKALRQKRKTMRNRSISETSDDQAAYYEQQANKGHRSNASEATITQDSIRFAFPTPPKKRDDAAMTITELPSVGEEEHIANPNEGINFMLSPPPSNRSFKTSSSGRRVSLKPRDRDTVTLYLDRPGVPCMDIAGGSSPDSQLYPEKPIHRTTSQRVPHASPRDPSTTPKPNQAIRRIRSAGIERHTSLRSAGERAHPRMGPSNTWSIMEEETLGMSNRPELTMPQFQKADDEPASPGTAESPISPMTTVMPEFFPAVPRTRQTPRNQVARLSAVGPGRFDGEPGWWGDDG